MTALKMHFDNGYYATVKALPKQKNKKPIRGLILEIPSNFLLETNESSIVYEIESNSVNIYVDKKKISNTICPDYTLRQFIVVDVAIRMSESGLSPKLCKMIDASGKTKSSKFDMVNLISKPSTDVLELEKVLDENFLNYLYEGIEDNTPKEILEGFKVLINRYQEGLTND